MIPYAKPYTSHEALAKVNELIRAGQFAPGEAAEAIENLFHGYHGVFVNSGTSANYLMVKYACGWLTSVSVPSVAFATYYAPLVAHGKELDFKQCDPDMPLRPINETYLHIPCPVLGMTAIKQHYTVGADFCECLEPQDVGKLDAFTMSFHPAHQINGGGGGCVWFTCEDKADMAREYASWGRSCTKRNCYGQCEGCNGRRRYEYNIAGHNWLGSEINAVIALDNWRRRDEIRAYRRTHYKAIAMAARSALSEVIIPDLQTYWGDLSPFAVPIRCDNPDAFKAHLRKHGIEYRDVFSVGPEYAKQVGYHNVTGCTEVPDHYKWLFIGCSDRYTSPELHAIRDAVASYGGSHE